MMLWLLLGGTCGLVLGWLIWKWGWATGEWEGRVVGDSKGYVRGLNDGYDAGCVAGKEEYVRSPQMKKDCKVWYDIGVLLGESKSIFQAAPKKEDSEMNQRQMMVGTITQAPTYENPYKEGSRQWHSMEVLKDAEPHTLSYLSFAGLGLGRQSPEKTQRSIRHMRKQFDIVFDRKANTYQIVGVKE